MAPHLTQEQILAIAGKLWRPFEGDVPESVPGVKNMIQLVVAIKRRLAVSFGEYAHLDVCQHCKTSVDEQIVASLGGGPEVRQIVESVTKFVLKRLYEGEIIRNAQSRRVRSRDMLVERYHDQLKRFCENVCRRYPGVDPADVLQGAWRNVLKSLSSFNTERGTSFRRYLEVVASREALNQAREQRKRNKLIEKLTAQILTGLRGKQRPKDTAHTAELLATVVQVCAETLSFRQQQILFRRAFLGEGWDEIAEAYEIKREAVRSTLARARRRVRDELRRRNIII